MKIEIDTEDVKAFGMTKGVMIGYMRCKPKLTLIQMSNDLGISQPTIWKHCSHLSRWGKIKPIKVGNITKGRGYGKTNKIVGFEVYDD